MHSRPVRQLITFPRAHPHHALQHHLLFCQICAACFLLRSRVPRRLGPKPTLFLFDNGTSRSVAAKHHGLILEFQPRNSRPDAEFSSSASSTASNPCTLLSSKPCQPTWTSCMYPSKQIQSATESWRSSSHHLFFTKTSGPNGWHSLNVCFCSLLTNALSQPA